VRRLGWFRASAPRLPKKPAAAKLGAAPRTQEHLRASSHQVQRHGPRRKGFWGGLPCGDASLSRAHTCTSPATIHAAGSPSSARGPPNHARALPVAPGLREPRPRSRRLTGRVTALAALLTVRETCGPAIHQVARKVFTGAGELDAFLDQRYALGRVNNPPTPTLVTRHSSPSFRPAPHGLGLR
jgi:hypothetical protein